MPKLLTNLKIERVSLVDEPASQADGDGAFITLVKRNVGKAGNLKECPECGDKVPADAEKCKCGYSMKAATAKESTMNDADKAKADADLKAAEDLAQEAETKAEAAEKRAVAAEAELAKLKNTPEEIEKRKLDALPSDIKKRLEDAEAAIKAAREEKALGEATELAKSYKGLAGANAVEFAPVLKAAKSAMTEEQFKALNDVLSTMSALVEKSAMFKQVGRNGSDESGDPEAEFMAKVKAAQKEDPKLSFGDAMVKVSQDNPGLYDKHRAAGVAK